MTSRRIVIDRENFTASKLMLKRKFDWGESLSDNFIFSCEMLTNGCNSLAFMIYNFLVTEFFFYNNLPSNYAVCLTRAIVCMHRYPILWSCKPFFDIILKNNYNLVTVKWCVMLLFNAMLTCIMGAVVWLVRWLVATILRA